MLYLILIFAVWRLYKRIKAHCDRYPYSIADYQQHEKTIETENYSIADYLPENIPKEEQAPDDSTQEQIEQLDEIKDSYFAVLHAIEQEQKALNAEYIHASDKRRSAIAAKLTALASKRASTLRTLQGLDAKQRKLSIT